MPIQGTQEAPTPQPRVAIQRSSLSFEFASCNRLRTLLSSSLNERSLPDTADAISGDCRTSSPITPNRSRLVPTHDPNPVPLTMPCRCGATISTFQHFFSITEAAAALFSADATDVVRTRPAHLTDAIFCAKHALMPDMSAFSKEPQSVQFSKFESSATDWVPVSAQMSQQLDADHRHLTSEECACLHANTSSPTCWADILLFFHAKQIPIFFPIPDLIVLSEGSPLSWLFTGSSGRIMIKAMPSLSHDVIHKSFTRSTSTLHNTEGCVAIISHYADQQAVDAGGDPVLSDILHAAMFEQLCEKIMVTTFDPDTQPLPSWLTDRTLLQLYVKPRDDIGWETHTQRCRDVFSVCHRTFQFSYRYMSMRQRRVYRSNLEVVRLFPRPSDALRNELSRISVAVMRLFWRARIGLDLVRCEFIKDYTGRLLLIKVSAHPNNISLPPQAAND